MTLQHLIDLLFGADEGVRPVLYRMAAAVLVSAPIAFLWALVWRRSWDMQSGSHRPLIGRFIRRFGVVLLLAVCVISQISVIIKERRFKLVEDTLYLPNSRTVSIVAVGYHELLADILFLRSIQAYGGGWQFSGRGGRPKLFEHYFNVITDLDPTFTKAYTFGNLLIGEEMRAPAPALGLLMKGMLLNPKSYRVAFEGGFFSSDVIGDYARGAHYLRWAVQAPDVPDWVARQIYYFKIKGGDFVYGFERYLRLYLDSRRTGNWVEEHIAKGRLVATTNDWSEAIIRDGLELFRKERGQYPANLLELVQSGYIKPWEIANAADLFRENEYGETLVDMIPSGMPIEDQVRQLIDVIKDSGSGIPPTVDERGWYYTRRPDDNFRLIKLSDNVAASLSSLGEQTAAIERALKETGVPPADLRSLLGQVSADPNTALAPDPDGSFLLYNPQTGSLGYMSQLGRSQK